jgi:predicted DNA-binding ribbon-helix-helix protein
MESAIPKRSIFIAGRRTNVSVEDAFWRDLKKIARARDMSLSALVTAINSERKHPNLSSAIRLFVLDHYRSQALSVAQKAYASALGLRSPSKK